MSLATFYRHFQDKYDLIVWIYRTRIPQTLDDFYDKIYRQIRYDEENKKTLLNLSNGTDGYQSVIRKIAKAYIDYFENIIVSNSGSDALADDIRREIYMYTCGMVLFVDEWLRGRITGTADEVAKTICDALPNSIKQLLPAENQTEFEKNLSE